MMPSDEQVQSLHPSGDGKLAPTMKGPSFFTAANVVPSHEQSRPSPVADPSAFFWSCWELWVVLSMGSSWLQAVRATAPTRAQAGSASSDRNMAGSCFRPSAAAASDESLFNPCAAAMA
jgi:hypothetical protein